MHFLLGFVLVITASFLILIVLLQRGRGGGLAGAFGGAGGKARSARRRAICSPKSQSGRPRFGYCFASVR